MTDASRPTTEISLLGRPYVVACPPEEQAQLNRAARYLDRAMHGIHARGKIIGAEKIAVMAALNITHELIQAMDAQRANDENLEKLAARLEKALASTPVSSLDEG
ncbi:cell division protein ZapA [Halomonas sp. WWR20]